VPDSGHKRENPKASLGIFFTYCFLLFRIINIAQILAKINSANVGLSFIEKDKTKKAGAFCPGLIRI